MTPSHTHTQTLLLGAGLSGAALALTLAARGQPVSIASGAPGGSAQWSGALDLFGPCLRDPSSHNVITDPQTRLQNLLLRRPHHPYRALHLTDAGAVSAAAAEITRPLTDLLDLTARGWALTPLGWPRWCDGTSPCVGVWSSANATASAGAAAPVGVVGFANVAGFDAQQAAATLTAYGVPAVAVTVDAPAQPTPFEADPLAAARRLDDAPPDPSTWGAVASALRAASPARPPARWLLPPLLGSRLAVAQAHLAALSALLGVEAKEATAQHDSLHGWRLQQALTACLRDAPQVEVWTHRKAARVEPRGGALVVTWTDGTQTTAARVVLATGRWMSGGLPRRGPWREPLTGAPLWLDGAPMRDTPAQPPRLLSSAFSDDHPLLRVGLAVDATGHVLGEDGQPLSPHLYAVGAALGGTAHSTDGSAAGVALCTAAAVARGL